MTVLLNAEQAETQDHTFCGPIRISNADLRTMSKEELDRVLDDAFTEQREFFHMCRELG